MSALTDGAPKEKGGQARHIALSKAGNPVVEMEPEALWASIIKLRYIASLEKRGASAWNDRMRPARRHSGATV